MEPISQFDIIRTALEEKKYFMRDIRYEAEQNTFYPHNGLTSCRWLLELLADQMQQASTLSQQLKDYFKCRVVTQKPSLQDFTSNLFCFYVNGNNPLEIHYKRGDKIVSRINHYNCLLDFALDYIKLWNKYRSLIPHPFFFHIVMDREEVNRDCWKEYSIIFAPTYCGEDLFIAMPDNYWLCTGYSSGFSVGLKELELCYALERDGDFNCFNFEPSHLTRNQDQITFHKQGVEVECRNVAFSLRHDPSLTKMIAIIKRSVSTFSDAIHFGKIEHWLNTQGLYSSYNMHPSVSRLGYTNVKDEHTEDVLGWKFIYLDGSEYTIRLDSFEEDLTSFKSRLAPLIVENSYVKTEKAELYEFTFCSFWSVSECIDYLNSDKKPFSVFRHTRVIEILHETLLKHNDFVKKVAASAEVAIEAALRECESSIVDATDLLKEGRTVSFVSEPHRKIIEEAQAALKEFKTNEKKKIFSEEDNVIYYSKLLSKIEQILKETHASIHTIKEEKVAACRKRISETCVHIALQEGFVENKKATRKGLLYILINNQIIEKIKR